MLTAVEFDNQMLRDAAEIGKVGTNPVLAANLNPPRRLLEGEPTTSAPRKSTQHEDAGLARAQSGAGGPARHSAELINRAPQKARG
jgi:hypothetical protein